MSSPLSITLIRSLATVVMIVGPPGEPSTSRSLPGRIRPCASRCAGSLTIVGVIALSGRNRIRRSLDEPKSIRHALLAREVVHLVVEQKTQTLDRHPRAEAKVE